MQGRCLPKFCCRNQLFVVEGNYWNEVACNKPADEFVGISDETSTAQQQWCCIDRALFPWLSPVDSENRILLRNLCTLGLPRNCIGEDVVVFLPSGYWTHQPCIDLLICMSVIASHLDQIFKNLFLKAVGNKWVSSRVVETANLGRSWCLYLMSSSPTMKRNSVLYCSGHMCIKWVLCNGPTIHGRQSRTKTRIENQHICLNSSWWLWSGHVTPSWRPHLNWLTWIAFWQWSQFWLSTIFDSIVTVAATLTNLTTDTPWGNWSIQLILD